MSDEKELIRRALMGEKQAQEECTEKGIVLPCPICGGEIKIKQCDWDMFYPYCNGCKFTFNFLFDSKKDAIEVVNDRPAPTQFNRMCASCTEPLGVQPRRPCRGEMGATAPHPCRGLRPCDPIFINDRGFSTV